MIAFAEESKGRERECECASQGVRVNPIDI